MINNMFEKVCLLEFMFCMHIPGNFFFFFSDVQRITEEIRNAPLPPFSERVRHYLDANDPESIWPSIITEAAEYYGSKWPEIDNRLQYQAIGEKITMKYPCLKMPQGRSPWVRIFMLWADWQS